ncbi:MAG TPA: prepilin-type N-terminal cleavage/methylation domain-containing protein [Phycisphaerales bacterium]|nr:prepilin-type N-terminal cleavage/methylation domain-containing protein [Phycisphaerales bacterium]
MRNHSPRTLRAYSLIELTVSLAIVSILVTAIGSLIILASKAIPRDDGVFAASLGGAILTEELIDDAAFALAFNEVASAAIEFTLPDRNGDGNEEIVRYTWSGTAGHPLTRSINGSSPIVVLPDVRSLEFAATTRSGSVFLGSDQSASSQDIQKYDTLLPLAQQVTNSNWFGFYCPPPQVSGATGWRVSSVRVKLLRSGAGGGTGQVQLRKPKADGTPGSTIYASANFNEDDLGLTVTWRTFNLDSGVVPAGQGICIVIRGTNGSNASGVAYFSSLGVPPGTVGMASTDSGKNWTTYSTTSALHEINGIVYASSEGLAPRDYVDALNVRIRAGAAQTAVEKTIRPLNRPEILD